MDPENRSKRVPIHITENQLGLYLPLTGEVAIGDKLARDGKMSISNASNSNGLSSSSMDGSIDSDKAKAIGETNGYPKGGGDITFGEVLGHELSHASTVASRASVDIDKFRGGVSPKRPYFYALSEEYKVGTLTFLNKSRQLTGKKLVNPQEIHQLFDEIEADPSILDKNYSIEEARLPRTYLHLKKTNPQGAELLRNATARDCQYLANIGKAISEQCAKVGNLEMHNKIEPSVIDAYVQLSHPNLQSFKAIASLNDLRQNPLSKWAEMKAKPKELKPKKLQENLEMV
jgi:hypothetical protein